MPSRRTNVEDIYEALIDDDLFEALPGMIADALDARSVLLHWHHGDGSADILSHSGYFTGEQLQLYATQFAPLDPWARATAGLQPDGTALNLEEIVSPEEYERSAFYNEYIRPMGDDTYRCMGLRSDTRWGSGMIAVQRGRGQDSFSPEEVGQLQLYGPHLRRLLVLRGRMAALVRKATTATAVLDAMRDAAIVVTADALVVAANGAGERLLAGRSGLRIRAGAVSAGVRDQALRQLILSACSAQPEGGSVLIDREDWPPLVVAVSPLRDAGGARQALLLVHEAAPPKGALETTLQKHFGLTRSEAGIACRLADGLSAAEIAQERRVSLGTIRGQMKPMFLKLGCSRQAEVIILLKSIPLAGERRREG